MQRKLISSNGQLQKVVTGILFFVFCYFFVAPIIQDVIDRGDLIFICIFLPIIGWVFWWVFTAVHPVYFDTSFLYWKKYGRERKIACDKIEEISFFRSRRAQVTDYGRIKFRDVDNKVKRIRFALIDYETI